MLIGSGLLVIRLLFGAAIAAHGAQKLFGIFGGYGLKGTGNFFEGLGFRPGVPFALAAGLSEFGGGVLLALGLFTPLAAAAVLSAMIVAMVSVHIKNGFFAMTNGIELAFLYAVVALGFGLSGPGPFSMDALLGLSFTPIIVLGSLLLSVAGAIATLAIRRPPAIAQSSAEKSAA